MSTTMDERDLRRRLDAIDARMAELAEEAVACGMTRSSFAQAAEYFHDKAIEAAEDEERA